MKFDYFTYQQYLYLIAYKSLIFITIICFNNKSYSQLGTKPFPASISTTYANQGSNLVPIAKKITQFDSVLNSQYEWRYFFNSGTFELNGRTINIFQNGKLQQSLDSYYWHSQWISNRTRDYHYTNTNKLKEVYEGNATNPSRIILKYHYNTIDTLIYEIDSRINVNDSIVYTWNANIRIDSIFYIGGGLNRIGYNYFDSLSRLDSTVHYGFVNKYSYNSKGLKDSLFSYRLFNGQLSFEYSYKYDSLNRIIEINSIWYNTVPPSENTEIISYDSLIFISGFSDELENSNLISYPNPVNDHLIFEFDINQEVHCHLSIINANGDKIKEFDLNSRRFILSTEDYSPGIYFYIIESNYGVQKGKFIKQ